MLEAKGATPMMRKCKKNGGKEIKPHFKIIPLDTSHMVKEEDKKKPEKSPQPAQVIPFSKPDKISSKQVFKTLKVLGKGWSGEFERLLAAPEELFYYFDEGSSSEQFSSDKRFGLAALAHCIPEGRLVVPECEYGILLYETASTVYFVLFDKKRRIAVREPIKCYHESPPEGDWKEVREHLKSTIERASMVDAKRNGLFAVYNGYIELLKPEKAQE